ncbi:MAG TPA: 50S ribosomal protein L17 [Terriglobia bacterium]|jgi:large subunit ribosomal protein L17|nr:50S ribosomal protein L17 [Terriglobia bacterium]
MRHRNYGRKLSRNTSHRRALLRNLVTSLIIEERIETTVAKAKAARDLAEHMITLGKRGDLHARRQAASYLLVAGAVQKLFDDVAKRFQTRNGGYTRIVPVGWRKGDGADTAVLELVGTEVLQKRAEERARRSERKRKAVEEAQASQEKAGQPEEGESGKEK